MSDFITATDETRAHYRTPGIMETILRVSEANGWHRWANGDKKDWYRGKNKRPRMMNEAQYKAITNKHRILYSSLSLFHDNVFDFRFADFEGDKLKKSCQYVNAYTFGIDIDTVDTLNEHGINIRDPEVKQAVEAAAQFFCDRLREYAPNSVYCLFSGGGIYVFLHHEVFTSFFDKISFSGTEDYIQFVRALTDALNAYSIKLTEEFFVKYPKYKEFVKVDHLNGAKRIFKTIFSIHKTHNFAVIPLDPLNVEIDFQKATIPLKKEVIDTGKDWYTEFDYSIDFLTELTPFLKESIEKIKTGDKKAETIHTEFKISETSHEFKEYPPCIRDILSRETCGVGATRALEFLAMFLGQIEPDREKSYSIWSELASRWKADALNTNVFQSFYRTGLRCPSCTTLNTFKGGFPHVDIKEIGACKPDLRCMQVKCSNPIYYTDNKLYIEKLKADFLKN